MTQPKGTLFLIPVPLGPGEPELTLPRETITVARTLTRFVVENAKTARAFLKAIAHPQNLREIAIDELNEHTPSGVVANFLQALLAGHDVGLMSEAGCPAIADPGSVLVALAHREDIRVKPTSGPSSILLALMASGMNGQCFSFHGYLPAKEPDRSAVLRVLELGSQQQNEVKIFIETPYRNRAMIESILKLKPTTRLCVACDLTLPSEWIRSATIAEWRKYPESAPLDRRPAVFLIEAN